MTEVPFVSVIIPVKKEAHSLVASLETILGQDYVKDCMEVLVADGGADDATTRILAGFAYRDQRVRLIDNPRGIVSTGLNVAIRAARGDIVIRMDAHTEYAPDYVRQCVSVLKETKADNVGGPWAARGAGYVSRAIAAAFQSPFAVGAARGHNADYEGLVDTVYLGCWPKEVFRRVGMFDEELVRNQDDEFNLRLTRADGKVWQSPRIRSWYQPRASLGALFRQYMQYGYWKVHVIRKHRLPASIRHLVPALFIAVAIALTAAAPFSVLALWALLGLAGLYLLTVGAASLLTARRASVALLPILPLVFACFHFGYGLGFLRGLWDLAFHRRPPSDLTALTRIAVADPEGFANRLGAEAETR